MHLVYVGYPGFPNGHAQVQRQMLIAKGLIAQGCRVTVLSRYGVEDEGAAYQTPPAGEHEGIAYVFTSGIAYRPSSFIKRNIYKLIGLLNELYMLFSFRSKNKLHTLLISTNSFYNVLLYALVAKLCGVQTILDNVEYCSSIKPAGFWQRIDYKLYDRYAFTLCSKVMCISTFLQQQVLHHSPEKPVIKIPAIVDYAKFDHTADAREPYFLFCGSAVYAALIDFILAAYNSLGQQDYKLYLVTNGSPEQLERVYTAINQSVLKEHIRVFSELEYSELVRLYAGSRALLIPLLNRQQDIARFPHKIGEYCASGRTLITTPVGEILHYFKDGHNAFVACEPSPEAFAAKMRQVITNPALVEQVSRNTYQTGKEHFDHLRLGRRIYDFALLQSRINRPATYTIQHSK